MLRRASPQSGRWQMIWAWRMSGLELIALLPKIYRGRHLDHPKAQGRLARRLKLGAEPAALVEADDELVGLTHLEVEIYPEVFQVTSERMRGM